MARLVGFAEGITLASSLAVARETSGIIAIDSATLTDANIDPTLGLNCWAWDTIWVGVEITLGTNPTATIEPLFRDADAPDGSRWKRRLMGAAPGVTPAVATSQSSGALGANSDLVEFRVAGSPLVYLRVSAVTNATSTTGLKILVAPGAVRESPRRR